MIRKVSAPEAPSKKVPAKPSSPPPTTEAKVRPLVAPDVRHVKTGCLYCPLACMHKDFDTFKGRYQRPADKILAKLKEPHSIATRNISEEWTEVDVLFVGDTPDGHEDKAGFPYAGAEYSMLRTQLYGNEQGKKNGTVGLVPENCPDVRIGYTHIVRCHKQFNADPGKTEVTSCSPQLIREIKARKPKLLVVTGNKAMEFLCGQAGTILLHGKFLRTSHADIPTMDVLACMPSGYVRRMNHETERYTQGLGLMCDYVNGEHVPLPGIGEYFVLETIDQVRRLFDDFRKEKKRVAFDTETGSLTPFQAKFPGLLCFSFSNTAGLGWTVPFDHSESPWRGGGIREKERPQLIRLLRQFFIDTTFKRRAQNEKFDRQHIRHAIGIELGLTESDTMTKHLTVDERRGTHGLKTLAYHLTGMGGYEKPMENYISKHPECDPNRGGSYANIPGSFLFRYAAMDADCTVRVDDAIDSSDEWAKSKKFALLAHEYFPKLSAVLAKMEYAGAQVDPAVVDRLDKKLTADMAASTTKILQFPMVQELIAQMVANPKKKDKEFKPGSKPQMEVLLFELYGFRPTELTDKGFDVLVARHRRKTLEAEAAKTAAPKFAEIVNRAVEKREWSLFTVDAEALHEIERAGKDSTNRKLKEGAAFATELLGYRGSKTLHSTFVIPLTSMLDANGRIHGRFNIMGTVTGRLSSDEPNLQNIPNKGGGTIKQAYVSRFGSSGLIVNVDFSQIELRIAAAWFNDRVMREVYVNKEDIHRLTASIIAGLSMEQFKKLPKEQQKEWRTRAKRVNFGVLYGGGPPALQATLKKDGVFVTLDECQAFIRAFFATYTGLRTGMDKLEAFVTKNGYLESFTGRRRRVPEVFNSDREIRARAIRQSINFPIQGGAGDMTLMALCIIDQIMTKEKMVSVPILTVHDSLVFDCHVDEFLDVANLAQSVMENIPSLSDEVMPGLDWSWMNVPIVADCDCGSNWGQMIEFDPSSLLNPTTGDSPFIGPNDKGKDDILRKPLSIDELWTGFSFKLAKAV